MVIKTKSKPYAISLALVMMLAILTVMVSISSAQESDDCPVFYDAIGPTVWSYTFNYWVNRTLVPDPAPLPGGVTDGFCFDFMWGVVDAYVDGEAFAAGWTGGYITSTTVVFQAPPPEYGDDYWGPWSGFHIVSEPAAVDGPVDWFCDHGAGVGFFDDLWHGPKSPVALPLIESCSSIGTKKDLFVLSEEVYVKGTGYSASTTYDIYVVNDVTTWSDGLAIPACVPGTAPTVSSDSSGNIPPTRVWSPPLTWGRYDIVVDVNGNGVYDVGIDALDSDDIAVTAGFFVIPEYPFGAVLGLAACLATLGAFFTSKRTRLIQL